MRYLTFLLLFCLAVSDIRSQNAIALPEIINYNKQAYNAGSQNWKICQDGFGILYFANTEGMISFDGSFWKKYVLPNGNTVRSLAIANDGRIYVGSQGEIGYFEPGKDSKLEYHSLSNLIPESEKDFTDVWDVITIGNEVFFRSFKRIFHYQNEKITVYSNISWSFLGSCNGQIISKAYKQGLLTLKEENWVPFLPNDSFSKNIQPVSLIPFGGDSSLIITRNQGSYILEGNQITRFNSPDMQLISQKNPYGATVISDNRIAIITSLGGCFIINKKGELIQRLSKQDGLQNNNVLSIYADRNKNLWIGLNNGIDFVAYDNAIKHIYPDYQEHSTGRVSIIYNDKLYIGTSNGLYSVPITHQKDISFIKSDFSFVEGSKGQVWNLSEINGDLLMGHTDGFFIVRNQQLDAVDSSTGFWGFLPMSNITPSALLLAGTYNGVNFYQYGQKKYTNPSTHSHFESARFVAIDGNVAWACHPYKGLYKVILPNEIKPGIKLPYTVYLDKKHILSPNNNYVFKIKSRIVLTNENGIFEYNVKTDEFEPSGFLKQIMPAGSFQYLKEDSRGNIWFIQNKGLGVVDLSESKPQTVFFPELNDRIMGNGFEFIYPYDSNNVFVAGEEGFYHINYEEYKKRRQVTPILLSDVKIINKNDSTIFGGYFSGSPQHDGIINQHIPQINYSWNSVHFDFSSSVYGKQSIVEYSYFLEDFDKSWSLWSKKNEKEYTYLYPGTYTFKVKARIHENQESAVISYRFTILPPWYRSVWAYLVYCLFFCGIFYTVWYWQQRKFRIQHRKHEIERNRLEHLNRLQAEKHEEQQKQLMYLHQLELERSEKEIIRLKNEKLESEIELKNIELASTTLNLMQKDETLVKVKEEFVRMKKVNDVDKDSEDYKKIIRMLGEDKMKKNWEQFAVHFDKVHGNFLVTIKERYPDLTPSELKLCAYLRLTLSSKEIAQVMNISSKSVELARYRLRKKLKIQPEVNLFSFLLSFHSENGS